MSETYNKYITILFSQVLFFTTQWQEIVNFGFLSVKTFILAGIAAVGSLVFKKMFNYVENKFKK